MDNHSANSNLEAKEEQNSYIDGIEKIKNSQQSAETKLKLLDLLIRDFLKIRFQTEKDMEYSELINVFLKKNQFQIAIFYHEMTKYSYSGEKISEDEISLLLEDAKAIMKKEFYIIKNEEPNGEKANDEKANKRKSISTLFNKFKKKKYNPIPQNIINISNQTRELIEKELASGNINKIDDVGKNKMEDMDKNKMENAGKNKMENVDKISNKPFKKKSIEDDLSIIDEQNKLEQQMKKLEMLYNEEFLEKSEYRRTKKEISKKRAELNKK